MSSRTIDLELHTFHSPDFESVVHQAIEFLKKTPTHPLPPSGGFAGAGVYLIYYVGGYKPYNHIAKANKKRASCPIYVGKAVPPGWRTARSSPETDSRPLYGRLREHGRSIEQVKNLSLNDFFCRFMLLQGIETDLVSTIESHLIRDNTPLWNTVVDGFGNHDPGSGRYEQAKSEWDVLHLGRSWAARLKGACPSLKSITDKIQRSRRKK